MRLLLLLLWNAPPPPEPLVTAVARCEATLTAIADRAQRIRTTERARLRVEPVLGGMYGVSFRIDVP
ncbi:MAG TPA: hypothetical protein VFF06_03015 [Polyangia bacterium]|nr:hypothetical protein [Polyangia bacterium]